MFSVVFVRLLAFTRRMANSFKCKYHSDLKLTHHAITTETPSR